MSNKMPETNTSARLLNGPVFLAVLLLVVMFSLRFVRSVIIENAKNEAQEELLAQEDDQHEAAIKGIEPRVDATAPKLPDRSNGVPPERIVQSSLASSVDPDQAPPAIDPVEHKRRMDILEKTVPDNIADLSTIEDSIVDLVPVALSSTISIRADFTQGSGVIVTQDGYCMTAAHVAEKIGRMLDIHLSDGTTATGKTIYIDRTRDFAIIQIEEEGPWPAARIASESPQLGQWCLATGHPGGYTEGRPAVVRLGRLISLDEISLESDCPLVGGDSGGPLFDVRGRVIGIHSRIGPSVARNFHVPVRSYFSRWDEIIELAQKTLVEDDPLESPNIVASNDLPEVPLPEDATPQVTQETTDSFSTNDGESPFELPPLNEKYVTENTRPFLGVYPEDILRGCRVIEVLDGSPADKGGMMLDDVMLKIDDTLIKSSSHLGEIIDNKSPGDTIVITIKRDDQYLKKEIKLGARKIKP